MTELTYEILICSIPHRREKLRELLECLNSQMTPGVGAILHLDNLEAPVGRKRQELADWSWAQYISFVDDDDMVACDFVPMVMAALASRPDYVGFPVTWSVDGVLQVPVQHSLRHRGWTSQADVLLRDISHLNPIRRELALLGSFDSGGEGGRYAEDYHWANAVRASGRVRTEAWIGKPMYFYRSSTADEARTIRQQAPEVKPPPRYPWLASIGYFPSFRVESFDDSP